MGKMYRIGEAARLLNLKTYVLRFWETEFPQLTPQRTDKGQRLYTEEHIALLRAIRHLLHEKGMTIEGAKKRLQEGAPLAAEGEEHDAPLAEIIEELEDIRRLLVGDGADI
ncbi:MAG: MerR family transcriptional regulator [Desulfovibrionaceae bacterium]|jgi:DNA-binding transcriptional MerR regulator|nr:MerR family transcriptional regulator [Desulfovibrionaceae bacterium]